MTSCARTLAQQFADHFDAACRPYQYALSTRSGAEALVHTLQVLTETSPTATVLSVDGVGAYDHVSRQAMLEALRDVPGACRLLPYVRMWYGSPSTYVWHDSVGQPHRVLQAEGGEQGDPLMPALFALAMHQALVALLRPEGRSLAFLDELHLTAQPDRIQPLFQAALNVPAFPLITQKHVCGTQPQWSRQASTADVWRGNAQLPEAEQGITARRHGPTMHFVTYPQNSPIFLPLITTLEMCQRNAVWKGRGGAPGVVG